MPLREVILSLEKTVAIEEQLKSQQHKNRIVKNDITGEERDLRYFEQNILIYHPSSPNCMQKKNNPKRSPRKKRRFGTSNIRW